MDYKHFCVIDAEKNYKTLVLILLEPDEKGTIQENIQYYTLATGETLVDTAPPTCKPYAGAEGLVAPRWDGTAWTEGATADEIAAWDAEHPAPELSVEPALDERVAATEAAVLALMGGDKNV